MREVNIQISKPFVSLSEVRAPVFLCGIRWRRTTLAGPWRLSQAVARRLVSAIVGCSAWGHWERGVCGDWGLDVFPGDRGACLGFQLALQQTHCGPVPRPSGSTYVSGVVCKPPQLKRMAISPLCTEACRCPAPGQLLPNIYSLTHLVNVPEPFLLWAMEADKPSMHVSGVGTS